MPSVDALQNPTAAGPATAARLAIDLGASNVKMAWLEDDGDRIIDSSERDATFPAVVAVRGDELLTGQDALDMSAMDPDAVLLHVREWLGLVDRFRLGGRDVKILDAVAALYRAAASATSATAPYERAVIVHPARWPARRVAMLAEAARVAGLGDVQVIPDAVAIAAVGPREGEVLVVDVGSTLTVSVVDAEAEPPAILWCQSSVGAGGEAIAQAIRAVTDVSANRGRELARGASPDVREPQIDWPAVRSEAHDGLRAANRILNEVLQHSKRDAGAISRIYIAGGASVAPFVRQAVTNRFKSEKVDKISELSSPATSAAYGALRLTRPPSPPNLWTPHLAASEDGMVETVDDGPDRATSPSEVRPEVDNSWAVATAPSPEPPATGERRSPGPTPLPVEALDVRNVWTDSSPLDDRASGAGVGPAGADSTPTGPAWGTAPSAEPASTTVGNTWSADATSGASSAGPQRPARRPARRHRRVLVIAAFVLAIALVAILVFFVKDRGGGGGTPEPAVPDSPTTAAATTVGS
jgi:hypothetical protein